MSSSSGGAKASLEDEEEKNMSLTNTKTNTRTHTDNLWSIWLWNGFTNNSFHQMATLKTSKNRVREESEAEQGWVQMGCQSFQNVVVDSEGSFFDKQSAPVLIQKCTYVFIIIIWSSESSWRHLFVCLSVAESSVWLGDYGFTWFYTRWLKSTSTQTLNGRVENYIYPSNYFSHS